MSTPSAKDMRALEDLLDAHPLKLSRAYLPIEEAKGLGYDVNGCSGPYVEVSGKDAVARDLNREALMGIGYLNMDGLKKVQCDEESPQTEGEPK